MRAVVKGNRLCLAALLSALMAFPCAAQAEPKKKTDKTDPNGDGVVNLLYFNGEPTGYYLKHLIDNSRLREER